jgi:preprotein translocase subunit SecD
MMCAHPRFPMTTRLLRLLAPLCGALTLFFATGCNTTGTSMSGGSSSAAVRPVSAKMFLETSGDPELAAPLPVSKKRVPVASGPAITEIDILAVRVQETPPLGYRLIFQLRTDAAKDFNLLTLKNQGRSLVLMIDGQMVAVTKINSPIANGLVAFYPEFNPSLSREQIEARAIELAVGINAVSDEFTKNLPPSLR